MARVWEDVLAGIQGLHERLDRIEAKLAKVPEATAVSATVPAGLAQALNEASQRVILRQSAKADGDKDDPKP